MQVVVAGSFLSEDRGGGGVRLGLTLYEGKVVLVYH